MKTKPAVGLTIVLAVTLFLAVTHKNTRNAPNDLKDAPKAYDTLRGGKGGITKGLPDYNMQPEPARTPPATPEKVEGEGAGPSAEEIQAHLKKY